MKKVLLFILLLITSVYGAGIQGNISVGRGRAWHEQEQVALNVSNSEPWASNENVTIWFEERNETGDNSISATKVEVESANNKVGAGTTQADTSGNWWMVFTIPKGYPTLPDYDQIGEEWFRTERINATGEPNHNLTQFIRDPNQVSLAVQLMYGGSGSNARGLAFDVTENRPFPFFPAETQTRTTNSSGQATMIVNEGDSNSYRYLNFSMDEQGRIGAKSETTLIGTDTGSYTWAIALEGAEPGGEVVYPEEGTTTTSTSGQRNLLYGLAIILLFVGGYLIFFHA